ncbi:hypothetical protein BT67DRAFT_448663 [Trichocladium antarcticum]|uniref:Ankyrin n=1 Tax=Trichocladium antarcticum TaxID=1450529 RepID=A0AAN6ZFE7_9PEZI|nr:hypothetical protein BT67DRAFT_448663 [Trichocladium antarcticum]
MASSPTSTATGPSPSGSRIGRPPQWTVSRSRKLARLYLYSTLSIEKIINVLEDDGFKPRKNSAQKTIHKMLDNDPRYLRPESRIEMSKRINSLCRSPTRRRRRKRVSREGSLPAAYLVSSPASSIKGDDVPSFDFSASPEPLPGYSRLPAPAKGGHGQQSTDRGSLDDYSATIQDVKRRVSDCSSHYAFQISTLIKEFTISVASDDDRPHRRRPSTAMSDDYGSVEPPEFETLTDAYEAFPEPGFALPGDFLSAHTRSCADFPGQPHGRGDCWCSIARETSAEEGSWLLLTGELSERGRCVLEHPAPANLGLSDGFGNTPLHLFAALEGYQEALLRMVSHCDGGSLRALNTAGQTFLHVLNLDWFADCASLATPLKQLLSIHLNEEGPYMPPRRTGSLSPQVEDLTRSRATSEQGRQSSSDEGSLLAYHARLVQVIQSSYTNPHVEDAEGRNGLHCLAEAIINQQTMDRRVQGVQRGGGPSSARPQLKRKFDAKDTSNRSSPSPGTTATSSPSPATTTVTATTSVTAKTHEPTLPTRLRHLQSLLHPSIALSATHYSRHGTTPLMAFVEHIPDDHDDKAKTLQALLETLLRWPTTTANTTTTTNNNTTNINPVLEARNRRGETALLLAARLGRKVALATLLEAGACVHARDVDGRGVLQVLDRGVGGARARGDVSLYARLEACRVLLTGRREWGVGAKKDDVTMVNHPLSEFQFPTVNENERL